MASSPCPPSSTPSHPSPFHTISIKLTPGNYLLWKVQFVHYLCGQRLYKFVDGTHLAPKLVLGDDTPNLDYDTTPTRPIAYVSINLLPP